MRSFLAVTIALTLISCKESSPTAPDGVLPLTEVYSDIYSGIVTRRAEVISSPTRWQEVWDEINSRKSPKPPLPAVDLNSSLLIFTALGETGDACKKVVVESVTRNSGVLMVSVKETRPPASCSCPPVIVQPVHVVAVQRLATGASFQWRSVTEGNPCN